LATFLAAHLVQGLAMLFGIVWALPSLAQPSPEALAGMQAYNEGRQAQAFRLLQRAADAGDREAMANLGYLFARGHGTPVSRSASLDLYRRAAQLGSSEGMNALGYRSEHQTDRPPDLDAALHWYCRAVERGNPRAMNNLAILVRRGRGVEADVGEAQRLWRQAAELGHANAMLNLGLSLMATGADRTEGRGWFERAAELGHPRSQEMLRNLGSSQSFPPPVNLDLRMTPAPVGVRGHSKVCAEALTS
jgi:TPR repeat protein